jgi:hypothetical protein
MELGALIARITLLLILMMVLYVKDQIVDGARKLPN